MPRRRPRCSCSQRRPAYVYAIATKPDGGKYPRVLCTACFLAWERAGKPATLCVVRVSSVCSTGKGLYSWSTIAQLSLVSVSVLGFPFPELQSGAHHGADGTQVSRDDYDDFKQAYKAKCDSDKQSVMLAASALVAVADEPESELEGSQMEALVPVVTAGRSSGAHAHTGKPFKHAARDIATGRLQEEIVSILAGKQEKPSRELINGVKQISKLVFKQGTFVVYTHKVSEIQDGQQPPLASSCKLSSWSGGRRRTATWTTIRRAFWASARRGRAL